MGEIVTIPEQIRFIKTQLDLVNTTDPTRVKMGRMTRKETAQMFAKIEAVLETLKWAAKLEPALKVIYDCTNKEQVYECIHCKSVALSMEEIMDSLSK